MDLHNPDGEPLSWRAWAAAGSRPAVRCFRAEALGRANVSSMALATEACAPTATDVLTTPRLSAIGYPRSALRAATICEVCAMDLGVVPAFWHNPALLTVSSCMLVRSGM